MKNKYFDLVQQNFNFPQEGFGLVDGTLSFYGVSLSALIHKYGTPLKLFYLPRIGTQINNARTLFANSFKKYDYNAEYNYCYCTKCNHFAHVIGEALKHNVHLETSSLFDIDLILNLYRDGKIDKNRSIIHNGYKTEQYLYKILQLQEIGFTNCIVILDSINELKRLLKIKDTKKVKIGLRMAINEEAQYAYYTSRMGIRNFELLELFKSEIINNDSLELKMLHFFVDSGIKDTQYYWEEFAKALNLYVDLKKMSNTLDSFNIGGGFPIRNNLNFEYDYAEIVDKIVFNIKETCTAESISLPNIYTEFGKYTVGESGATIFQVLEQKQQNDTESWYIIDNSLINTIPDAWSIHERFILLPINKWQNSYRRVSVGGISCDQSDYYNSEDFNQKIYLPEYSDNDSEPLYLGFFHTGAYQDAISGYGGIKHCLIPSPKQIIIDVDENGDSIDYLYRDEQSADEMFKILGYKLR